MASQLGLPLVPDTSYYYPRFYLGLSEGEKRESGEIPSCDMCFDGRYYAVSGFITGAIGAKFPGMNHLVEGVVDTTVSAGERLAYAVFDDSMSWDEKRAYAFDPGQMVADFVTGVVIGEILDGIMAATQNKLRSIFVNYDAAMCEAIESGDKTAKEIIGDRVQGFDLEAHSTSNKQLSSSKMKELKNKIDSRTATREEYNLYEAKKIFLDNKSWKGNDLAWIMDDKSVCLSEHGDGGPYFINEIDLPKDAKTGEVYEKIDE